MQMKKKKKKGIADLLKVAQGFCVRFSLCECLSVSFVNSREDGSTQDAKIVLELGTGGASWSRVGTSLTLLPPAMSLLEQRALAHGMKQTRIELGIYQPEQPVCRARKN